MRGKRTGFAAFSNFEVSVFCRVVPPEPVIRPSGSAAKPLVLDDGRVLEKVLLLAVRFEAFVGAKPDAVAVAVDFAAARLSSSARAIALILCALGFRAQERDLGKGAVAAILATEQSRFAEVLNSPQDEWTLAGIG